ncbi:MAG: hypothetical protein NTY19_36445 [Planctomycetota bacterium]|nr:hypothetical protein [Planctomycetota bacterium]
MTTVSLGLVLFLATGPLRAETWSLAAGNRLTFITLDFEKLSDGFGMQQLAHAWSLVVTKLSQNRIQGLMREENRFFNDYNNTECAWNEVTGTVDGDRVALTGKQYRPESQSWTKNPYAVPQLQATMRDGCVDWKVGNGPNPRDTWQLAFVERLSPAELESLVSEHKTTIEKAGSRWAALSPTIRKLRAQGHELNDLGVLETGDIRLLWSDYASGTYVAGDGPVGERYVEGRGNYVKDYQMLAELAPLGYVDSVHLGNLTVEDDVRHLASIPAIGHLSIRKLTGRRLSSLSGIEQLRMLSLSALNDAALKEISTIRNLEGVSLMISSSTPKGEFTPSNLALLKSLPKLKCVRIVNYDQDALTYLEGLKSLETLDLGVSRLSDRSVEAINKFPRLKSFSVEECTVSQFVSIQNPSLQRIWVERLQGLSDADLVNWKSPPKLQLLRLPYWTPGSPVAYIQRLKTMPAKERSLYQVIRLMDSARAELQEILAREQLNIVNREDAKFLGAWAMSDVTWWGRDVFIDECLETMRKSYQFERTLAGQQRAIARNILDTGRKAQQLLAELVAAGTLKSECVMPTQLKLYSTSGEVLPALADRIEPASLKLSQSTYDELKELAER